MRETLIGPQFEFDSSPSSSSSLSSVRVLLIRWARVSLKVEFDFPRALSEGSLVPCLPDADLWGKVRGEKGEISTGLMIGYLVGWCGGGFGGGGGEVEINAISAQHSWNCA